MRTKPDYTLYQWFSRSVEQTPNAVAIEVGDQSASYVELAGLADALAAALLDAHGAVPRRVALLASRSMVAFAGYLAALRLGAAVIPLNPGFPAARNRSICAQLPFDVLLADKTGGRMLDADLADTVGTVVRRTDAELPSVEETWQLPPYRASLDDIAYVLFTSGSTGRPKGVPITHRNVSAYVAHNIARYGIGPGDRVSNTFDLTFDPSVFDMFVTWAGGATVVCPPRNSLLAPVDYLVDRRITHWSSVPAMVSVGADLGNLPTGRPTNLRHSIFIGEQLTYQQARAWHAVAPNSTIGNAYGPTELTVTCTEYQLPVATADWPSTPNDTVPIGPVYDFLDHVIIDENGRLAGEGELCVRGAQRFAGYLDPSDNDGRFLIESGDRFVPYTGTSGQVPPECYYRTGDRVRRMAGDRDNLVHLGRLDQQVKILGYRVELGEIEAVLARHPDVNQAVVVTVPATDPLELNGFYTGTPVAERELVRWMRTRLLAQVVPKRLVHMDTLPLNVNGKINRGALRDAARTQPAPLRR